jgi:hypothetical protein
MIVAYACAGLAFFLFVLLFFVGSGRRASGDELFDPPFDSGRDTLCPPDIVTRIFSREDRDFIRELNLPSLRSVYNRERKTVARKWIRQTSAAIRNVMREHLRHARSSQNLEFGCEASLFARYIELRWMCGLLSVSTYLVTPALLQELAVYACNRSHRLITARLKMDVAAARSFPGDDAAAK